MEIFDLISYSDLMAERERLLSELKEETNMDNIKSYERIIEINRKMRDIARLGSKMMVACMCKYYAKKMGFETR